MPNTMMKFTMMAMGAKTIRSRPENRGRHIAVTRVIRNPSVRVMIKSREAGAR